LNDVDGLVLLSILQAQRTSFYVAFAICVLLLSFQSPLLNSIAFVYQGQLPGLRFFLSMLASYSVQAQTNDGFASILRSYDKGNTSISSYTSGGMQVSLVALIIESVHIGIFAIWCAITILFVVYKFYKLGSDPLSGNLAHQSELSLNSSDQPSPAAEVSTGINFSASYVSPSRAILDSIKRFNTSSVRSENANAAT
jgi:hypothetical protein